jgi:hypothetical protein
MKAGDSTCAPPDREISLDVAINTLESEFLAVAVLLSVGYALDKSWRLL